MKNDNQTLWSCLRVASESNQIGSLVMIDFLGILWGDDCFIGANEWLCAWWRHRFSAKLVTASATWGFDGRKLCPGVWPADSAMAWTLSQCLSPEDSPKSPFIPACEGLRKTCAPLHVLWLSSCRALEHITYLLLASTSFTELLWASSEIQSSYNREEDFRDAVILSSHHPFLIHSCHAPWHSRHLKV